MRKYSGAVLIVALLLAGCAGKSSTQKITAYFDVKGLFGAQADHLKGARFQKSAFIDGKEETTTVEFDSLEWTKELSMFINMDINKAVLVGAFSEATSPTANGKLITYTRTSGTDSGIEWIKLEKNEAGEVIAFSGFFRESNALYQNQRTLNATFEVKNGTSEINTYSIEGFQKILMKDTVNYSISALRLN